MAVPPQFPRIPPRFALLALATLFAFSAFSAEPQPQQPKPQELDFSPPPVPEFMLRRPEKPLTLEEMKRQAEEASRRARAEKERRTPPEEPRGKSGPEDSK